MSQKILNKVLDSIYNRFKKDDDSVNIKDFIDILNFAFIANDMWIMWSVLIIVLTLIIIIGKNK